MPKWRRRQSRPNQAQESANAGRCRNDQRQINLAVHLYGDDADQYIVPMDASPGRMPGGGGRDHAEGLFYCPTVPADHSIIDRSRIGLNQTISSWGWQNAGGADRWATQQVRLAVLVLPEQTVFTGVPPIIGIVLLVLPFILRF